MPGSRGRWCWKNGWVSLRCWLKPLHCLLGPLRCLLRCLRVEEDDITVIFRLYSGLCRRPRYFSSDGFFLVQFSSLRFPLGRLFLFTSFVSFLTCYFLFCFSTCKYFLPAPFKYNCRA